MAYRASDGRRLGAIGILAAAIAVAGCSGSADEDMDGEAGGAGGSAAAGGAGGSAGSGGSGGSGGTTDDGCDWQAAFESFFAQDHVVDFRIDFDDPSAWQQMLANKMAKEFHSATVTIDGEAMSQVGVRFKGNSSLNMSQDNNTKSFKVHFEQYVDGQRFGCVDRVSLNNNTKDPSMMRERLAYQLAGELGVVAPHTAYAEVTVDGALHGVFTMVQQVDHRFLKERYGTENHADDGNLYKLYSNYDFGFLGWGATPDDYGDSVAETGLVLKTNEDDPSMNDFSDVTELVAAIDAVLAQPSADNRAALEQVFDIDSYLRYQAWTLAISNLDVYYGMQHNLYVYHSPQSGKFETLPWDLNEAFGSFACRGGGPGGPPPDEDVYTVDLMTPCGDELPLNRLSYEVPEYRSQLCEILLAFVDTDNVASGGLYNVNGQDSRIAALHALVGEARLRMDEQAVLSQPPGDYNYDDYLTGQSQSSQSPGGGGPPGPGSGPNLGYFNNLRLDNLPGLIDEVCGN